MHELSQRIARADTPVRQQPVARALVVPREPGPGLAQPLQQRNGIGVDEFGIDELGIAIGVRRHMPLALDMLAQEWRPVLILNPARRLIVDPDVVETLRTAFKTDTHNRALGSSRTRRSRWLPLKPDADPEQVRSSSRLRSSRPSTR